MDASRESLLQPSLAADARPSAAPYSVQATFLTGFFGGPFAAIALIAVNSFRLRRLGRDWPVFAACLVATIVLGWVLNGSAPAVAPLRDWLDGTLGQQSVRYAYRFVALIFVGVGYLLHRREQRNTDVLGLSRPNGWIAGGLCALGGIALLAAFMAGIGGSR